MPNSGDPDLRKWKIEKSVSLGDLVTIGLMFIAAATYVNKNETDKTHIAGRVEAESKASSTYAAVQAGVDARQDTQRDSARADITVKFNAIDAKLDNLTFYLLKGKTP